MNSKYLNILYTGLSSDNKALQILAGLDRINFIHFPTIEIIEHELTLDEQMKLKSPDKYDFIIFTSINSVKYFLNYFENDYSALNCKSKIVAIGQKTASLLLNNNIDVDLIPQNSSSESIDNLLTEALIKNKLILIPGSNLSKADLFNSLESKGATVDFVAIYDNIIPNNIADSLMQKVVDTNFDLFVFTSPSTYYNFLHLFNIDSSIHYFLGKTIAVIGPVTKAALEKDNIEVQIMPEDFNLISLTNEIKTYYKLNWE